MCWRCKWRRKNNLRVRIEDYEIWLCLLNINLNVEQFVKLTLESGIFFDATDLDFREDKEVIGFKMEPFLPETDGTSYRLTNMPK